MTTDEARDAAERVITVSDLIAEIVNDDVAELESDDRAEWRSSWS